VHELDEALDVMEAHAQANDRRGDKASENRFIVVEFSQSACDVYQQRMQKWTREQALGAGMSEALWEQRQSLGPEFAYYCETIDCERAQCGNKEDEARIRQVIEVKEGSWARLNLRVAEFRRPRQAAGAAAAPLPIKSERWLPWPLRRQLARGGGARA
jgi:hypothetical protein